MHLLLRANSIVFPPSCRGCGRMMNPLLGLKKRRPAGFPYLCLPCHEDLPWMGGSLAGNIAAGKNPVGNIPGVDRLWAACRYESPVSDWIHMLKYGRRDTYAALLATLLREAEFGPAPLRHADAVVPVPLHPRRLRRRGFNQSLLLADRWRRSWRSSGWASDKRASGIGASDIGGGLPPLNPRLLARRRDTRPQVELDGAARETNVAGAFAVPLRRSDPSGALSGMRVLLVDDVTTTGSTLSACALALKEQGAARVEALVAARA